MSAEPNTQIPGSVGPVQVHDARNLPDAAPGGDRGFQYLMTNDEGRAQLMANSSLQKDEWEELQDAVIEVRRQGLSLVNDIQGQGLTRPMSLSTMTSIWQKVSHVPDNVEVTMNPGTRTDTDDVEFSVDGAPLPVVHMDWHIDRRMLLVSRNMGQGLDVTVPAQLTRLVNEKLEEIFVEGVDLNVDGHTMFGFRNHPSRNQVTGDNWYQAEDTDSAEAVRNTFLDVIEAVENNEYDPPYRVVLNRAEWQRMRRLIDNFGTGTSGRANMRNRIQDEFSGEIEDVSVSPKIPAGEAVAYKPVRDVVTAGVAEDVQAVEWREPDGWTHHFKVLAAMNLELKDTAEEQAGFAHITGLQG